MKPTPKRIFILMLAAATLILGCANAKPFDYHSGNEIPEGPGLFSKEKGSFTIYSSEKEKQKSAEKQSGQPNSGADTTQPETTSVDNSEEFRQFKEWQDEQKEFEAFQQWKESPENKGEYQEFQEWKRWKTYQEWQKAQHKSQ